MGSLSPGRAWVRIHPPAPPSSRRILPLLPLVTFGTRLPNLPNRKAQDMTEARLAPLTEGTNEKPASLVSDRQHSKERVPIKSFSRLENI